MEGKTVVIIGGAGFIGSSLAERLCENNTVLISDNFLTGNKENIKNLKNVRTISTIPTKTSVDYIFYLGGKSSLPLFSGINDVTEDIEAFGDWLHFAEKRKIPFFFASTSSFYREFPSSEDSKITSNTYYEAVKMCMENMARASHETVGTRTMGFRFFSVYGKRERYKGKLANLITQMLKAQRLGQSFQVYGDGEQKRDFTYIKDLLDGIMILVERGESGKVYNIGYGKEYTINWAAQCIRDVTEKDLKLEYIPTPLKNYVTRTSSDSTKIRALGWLPKYDLRDGLRDMLNLE